jgi:hypothetical protein
MLLLMLGAMGTLLDIPGGAASPGGQEARGDLMSQTARGGGGQKEATVGKLPCAN